MTHSSKFTLQLFSVLIAFTSCGQTGKKYLDIHSNSFNRGHHCYILWTTDITKCPAGQGLRLTFDSNNVAYVHRKLRDEKDSIRVLDENGKNISNNMINLMGDVEDSYLTFYNPTDEEIKLHPHFDEYYKDKLMFSNKEFSALRKPDLIRLGYKFENKH